MSSTDPSPSGCWRFASVMFDARAHELRVRGVPVEVPRKSLLVLQELLQHAGEVVTKDELAERCWSGRAVTDSVLTTTVRRLRQALGEAHQTTIQTVKGYGYRLAAPVSFDGPVPSPVTPLNLRAGDHPPGRPTWTLVEPLGGGQHSDIWIGRMDGASDTAEPVRVFKFAVEGRSVAGLKREVTIHRLLRDIAGETAGFVRILDWQFEHPPAFIATEYVAEGSLERWVQGQGGFDCVPLEKRLDLAAQCAEAVGTAHAVGVLHKDLKPANILVDVSQGEPRVRLCDFGSGTIVEQERLRRYLLTQLNLTQQTGSSSSSGGTPMYMAPEVLTGQGWTPRGDVYALGILLYQLVIGAFRRPLAAGWEGELTDELLREDIAACAAGDPARRLGDAHALARRLRSLEERREQRAREHAEKAHADALARELARSRQRRPWVIGLAATFAAGFVATAALSYRLQQSLAQERRQAAISSAVNRFLQEDILASANPSVAGMPDPSMRDVLIRAQTGVGERFAGEPLQEGVVRRTLGETWHRIGNDADAEDQLRRAIALLDPLGPAARLERARAYLALGNNLSIRGHPEATAMLDRAIGLSASHDNEDDRKIRIRARLQKARMASWDGRLPAALDAMLPIRDEARAELLPTDPVRNLVELETAAVLNDNGRRQEALESLQALLPHTDALFGPHSADAADQRRLLASVLRELGRLREAQAVMARALADFTSVLGADNAETLRTRVFLAVIRALNGQADDAIAELRSLRTPMKAAEGALGYIINLDSSLVDLEIDLERWEDAERDARVGIENVRQNSEENGVANTEWLGLAHTRLAYALTRQGRLDEAARHYDQAFQRLPGSLDPEAWYWVRAQRQHEEFMAAREQRVDLH